MDTLNQSGILFIQYLQNLFGTTMNDVMQVLSIIGRVEFYLVVLPFIYWAVDRRTGIRAFILLVYAHFTASALKLAFHQPRPYWLGELKPLSTESSYGLPSGHATDTLAVGGFLIDRFRRKWFTLSILVLIVLIGLSRMYLGVHYLADVLAGWFAGAVVLWAFLFWQNKVRAWLATKSTASQIGLGLIDSLLMIVTALVIRFLIDGTPDPVSWSSYSVDARSITHFYTLAGAAFGVYAGYALTHRFARFNAGGPWGLRIARYLIGLAGLITLYFGLDVYFATLAPDASTLGYILRYLRYALATFWTAFLAPWLFIKFRLAQPEA